MTKEFQPQLLGVDQDTINKKMANWKNAISEINSTGTLWTELFGETLQPHHVLIITGLKEVTKYLKEHFVNLSDNELANGVRAGKYEMKAALENMKFPDFTDLKNSINGFNLWLNQSRFVR
jgi:hypothetical protein